MFAASGRYVDLLISSINGFLTNYRQRRRMKYEWWRGFFAVVPPVCRIYRKYRLRERGIESRMRHLCKTMNGMVEKEVKDCGKARAASGCGAKFH